MLTNCSRYLGVYDTNLIYSWTPNEYRNFLKGARLKEIDKLERDVFLATLTGSIARNQSKNLKPSPKKYFDADKARKEILDEVKMEERNYTNYHRATSALKNFKFT